MADVLIVDDYVDVCRAYVKLVGRLGYTVDCAYTAHDALAAIDAAPPKLILLDFMLPDIDGLEVLRRVRALVDLPRIAVVMNTAVHDGEVRKYAMEMGADEYYVKGEIDLEKLPTLLAKYIPR